MGTVFGTVSGQCVECEVFYRGKYELRKYGPVFVAEIECDDHHYKNAIATMMRYLGEVGTPENVKGSPHGDSTEHIASESVKIPTLLPVLRYSNKLQFILPSEYASVDQIPVPTDQSITLRSLPARTIATYAFIGRAPREIYMKHLARLSSYLTDDHLLQPGAEPFTGSAPVCSSGECVTLPTWSVARYHPFSTSALPLPIFRKNEVWIEIEEAVAIGFLRQRHLGHDQRGLDQADENVTPIQSNPPIAAHAEVAQE